MPSDRESSSNSSGRNGVTTRIITKRSTGLPQTVNPDIVAKQKHEEWTTSKKVVNHKTKQVETRVQRQIILEDGKVVADSGPQVTTKTTEDNKVEESENTEHKKTGDDEDLGGNYVAIPGSARVVSEKTESHNVMKETKEENMQLHDENVQELNGPDIHRKSLVLAPNESSFYSLDTLKQLPGKLTHYSSKSKKITDKEEVKETSEMLKNGEMVTNTTRTHHHEEEHDDEVPEDEANQALPNATTVPKRLTYNYEEEIDSLSDKIRKEKELNIIRDIAAERRDPVTRKALSIEEEEEIRNSETNRWLENHFGSDESDIAEPTRPKTGGNVINIRMSSTPKTNEQSSRVTKIKDEIDSRLFKSATTANIGSRFCGTREPDIVYTTLRTPTPNSAPRARESPDQYSSLSSSRTPLKTYYLGQEGSYQRLSPPKETPLRRVSAPVWKSTPTLNDPVFNTTYKPRFHSRDETAREERTLRTSPVQRSVSQRDISPRQRLHSKVTAHDDGFIHKFSRDNFDEEENSWLLSSKTLPRGQKFTSDKPKQHRTSYSEVQSFSTGGKKTDRSVQVELSDEDDSSQVFSSILSRVRSPSPEYEITSLPRRSTTKKSVLVGPNKSKFFFGNANSSNHKDDYRKLYSVKSEGTTSRYSDGYGSLPSSKDRYHTEKEDSSIDRRIASFNTYGKSDNSYDGSTITSDYTRNNRYSNEVRTEERRKNSKNRNSSFDNRVYLESRDEVDYGRRKSSNNNSNDRRHFIDTLLTEEEPMYTRKLAPERRQRAMYSSSPPSPPRSSTPPSSSPPPRLIRADRFGGSSSLSPPDSPVAPPPPPPPPAPSSGGGTWKNRNIRSKSTGTPVVKMPNFTPLMSPVEIKNMANTINRSRSRDESRMYTNDKYMDVKPGSKNGTVVVEVRDWGNRLIAPVNCTERARRKMLVYSGTSSCCKFLIPLWRRYCLWVQLCYAMLHLSCDFLIEGGRENLDCGPNIRRNFQCLYYFRAGSTFLFSHIGLCGLVVGYAIMGAFAFEALESDNEERKRKEMAQAGAHLVEQIWAYNVENPMFFKDNWTLNISDELKLFELKLVTAMRKEGWDGNEVGENQWSFSGALLYSIIVITTIGYGNIAPKTDYGKMVTILYAIVGIPLMLLCLSNIGDAMAHSFKFMYWKLCCYFCVKPKKRRKSHHRSFRQQRYGSRDPDSMIFEYGGKNDYANLQPSGPGPGGQLSPNNVPTSSYGGGSMGPGHLPTMPPSSYNMSHSHSIYDRYSDHVDARQVPIISNKYILTDDIPSPSHIDHHSSTLPRPTGSPSGLGPSVSYGRSETLPRTRSNNRQQMKGGQGGWGDERVDIDFENDSDSEDSDEEEQISVPIWLCLAIVVGYICGGACLFMIWEDWGFLDSSYFCFVTLTTIGFGDLVPGTAVLSNDAQLTLSLCALYLLFGMALLAMSFNLVQEEVTKSVKSVGKRLGILSDDDEDN